MNTYQVLYIMDRLAIFSNKGNVINPMRTSIDAQSRKDAIKKAKTLLNQKSQHYINKYTPNVSFTLLSVEKTITK